MYVDPSTLFVASAIVPSVERTSLATWFSSRFHAIEVPLVRVVALKLCARVYSCAVPSLANPVPIVPVPWLIVKSPARVVDRLPIVPVVLLRVAIVPVVLFSVAIVPVVLLSVAIVPVVLAKLVIVPLVIVAAVEVVVPKVAVDEVRVGITPVVIVPVVLFRVEIVPVVLLSVAIVPVVLARLVIVAAVEVVVPNVAVDEVRFGITPVAIVPVVLLRVAIVPVVLFKVVIVAVGNVPVKLATVMRFKLLESEKSPNKSVSSAAMVVSAVRSWMRPEVGVAALTSAASLAAVTSLATPSVKVVPAENEAIV